VKRSKSRRSDDQDAIEMEDIEIKKKPSKKKKKN
jgi:hypothetical protein